MANRQSLCLGLIALGCIGPCLPAHAIEPFVEYRKHVEAAQTLTALTDQLMGDSVSLYNGATEFSATDIDLPGNNVLPVQLSRRFSVELHPTGANGEADASLYGAGNWNVEVPYISASYVSGSGWAANRCSVASIPSAAGFDPTDYWHGNSIHLPGGGDRPMLLLLESGIPRVADGAPHLWTTRERDMFTCIPMKSGLSGEGFRMLTTSGVRYYFDVAVSRYAGFMTFTPGEGLPTFTVSRVHYYLLASKIEDRFGNTVSLVYNTAGHPTSITSSDGRTITLGYSSGRLTSATANGRTWQYGYGSGATAGMLTSVTLPDTSKWQYAYTGTLAPDAGAAWDGGSGANCNLKPPAIPATFGLTVTHPGGATGTFQFNNVRHYRAGIHKSECQQRVSGSTYYYKLHTPHYFDVMSLQSKSLSGPGLAQPMSWSYNYGISNQGLWGGGGPAVYPCTTCSTEKTVTVTRPDSTKQQYRYGFLYALNEGKLLGSSTLDANGSVLRAVATTYLTEAETAGQNFFPRYGTVFGSSDPSTAAVRPVTRQTIQQDGATFTMQVNKGCSTSTAYCFDTYGNPTKATKFSTLGFSKAETTSYHDDTALWILGQIKTTTTAGIEASRTDFGWMALPWKTYEFGKIRQTFGYNTATGTQKGTITSVQDGGGNTIGLSNWKGGVPQVITYPPTTDHPAVTRKSTVDGNGWITSITDENSFKTCYGYDDMGRIDSITYPSEAATNTCNTSTWVATSATFQRTASTEYGIPANHWKQTVSTGNGRKVTYFDAFWRPLVEETYDNTNVGSTRSITVKRYDNRGRLAFQSYPLRTLSSYATATAGMTTSYDALDRVTQVSVPSTDSVTGTFKTTTEYLAGFRTRVTNPRGFATTTRYQAFDQPTTDVPAVITHPEGAYTYIGRDVFDKPTYVVRRDGPGDLAIRRSYVYDQFEQLCKTIEPETGSTVMHYDAAGNLDWSAAGLNLASVSSCQDTDASIAARKVMRSYDARNRIRTLVFPDHSGDTYWTYTPDGQLASIIADNGGADQVETRYVYNHRRLVTEERELWGSIDWSIGYAYDANGHLSQHTYHDGLVVAYSPNALGQPTQAGSYVDTVSYHPNGGIAGFTYGNNIVHSMTQNDRQLPERSRDVYGSTATLDDSYDYDGNGNVVAISDALSLHRGDRTMTYDGLDRLRTVVSPMYGSGGAGYTYDVLDNLTRVKVGATATTPARNHYYTYDEHWQLTNVKTDGFNGETIIGLGYDEQGNLSNKNGVTYAFDYGNRLRGVNAPASSYVYDGHGRRVRDVVGASKYSQYNSGGQLMLTNDLRQGVQSWYIYLGGSLVAIRERDTGTGVITNKYQHTDALGSPVAVTSQARTMLEHSEFEPYGKLANRPLEDGPGYTGHVSDAATGLTYMQQRYYDPFLQRFLSVDPVAARPSGDNFNRYWYANNNPYKFTDPDGRETGAAFRVVNNATNGKPVEPPPRSPQDKLGPAIGVALGAVVAAPVVAELGMVALANPSAVATATTVAGEAAGVTGLAGGAGAAARALSAEGKALANAQPVGSALKSDTMHRAASFVRQEAAEVGTHTPLVGGDGVTRTLTQVPGGLNGQAGRFEYIVEQGGNMTHQRFVPNGTINGVPNKP